MTTLTDFLLARIAEDEDVARPMLRRLYHDHNEGLFEFEDCWNSPILCIDPRRALSECESRRRIIGEHRRAEWDVQGKATCETCVSPDDWTVTDLPDHLIFPCRTLRHLAAIYADHPDYLDEWRP